MPRKVVFNRPPPEAPQRRDPPLERCIECGRHASFGDKSGWYCSTCAPLDLKNPQRYAKEFARDDQSR